MGFREVASLDAEKVVTLGGKDKKTGKTNPKTAEGYYLGKRVVAGKKFGDSTIYFLQTATGNLGVWGKTDMNRKLGSVEAGTMVRITHVGMTPTPNGDMHKYKVEVDPDNTIDVSNLESSSNDSGSADNGDAYGDVDSGYNGSDGGYDTDDEQEEETYEEEEAPEEAPRAQAPSPDRQKRVQDILNKKNNARKGA